MIKRIEFTLNLDDPQEAAIYRVLRPSIRYRRGGAVIRNALSAQLLPSHATADRQGKQEPPTDEQT